jgi:hypothetical protein
LIDSSLQEFARVIVASINNHEASMPTLTDPEKFAQMLARGMSASAAYVEAGYKSNWHNAAAVAREKHIRTRVSELQEEHLATHQQATAQ